MGNGLTRTEEYTANGIESKIFPEYVGTGNLLKNMSENQKYALEKKYLLRDDRGEIAESPKGAIYRMARTMAEVEKGSGKSDQDVDNFTKEFYDVIADGYFSPAGRIWTNAGTHVRGLFNCYVLGIEDNIEEIFNSVGKAAIIHKNGGGTGYNFSHLRPRGTYVQKSKGIASGPISFIGQFDKETEIINSGNRRGANMGILNIEHPNIFDFIYAKSVMGELKNFNVSVGASEEFMSAVEREDYYNLQFPKGTPFNHKQLSQIIRNIEENKIGGSDVGQRPRLSSLKFDFDKVIPGETKIIDTVAGKVSGRVAVDGRVQLYAPYVMDKIAELAWKTADPGMIFLDEINRNNPLPNLGPMEATNPCGEQPLHHNDACNLGSIVLSNFVTNDNGKSNVDYDLLRRTVKTATRFMDNVNDANEGPIPEIKKITMNHRRIGLGVMGWADMLIKLGVPYNSQEASKLGKEVMGIITDTSKEASAELAKEKDVFPSFKGSIYDNGKLEDRVRNVQRTTIAPTGTISMVYDVSSGIEPIFAVVWKKHIRGGDQLNYVHPLFVQECEKRGLDQNKIIPLVINNHGSVQGIKEIPEDLQRLFKTAHDLDYKDHIKAQAAFQERTDNAVSKTINMKNESTVEDVKNAYMLAWKNKLKGITVYRDGSKDVQVLTTGNGGLEDRIELVQHNVKNDPRLEIRDQTLKYKVGRTQNKDTLHVIITSDLHMDDKTKKAYFIPAELFQERAPLGASDSVSFQQSGIDRTEILRGENPNYVELIERWQSASSNEEEGIGPRKLKSKEHAVGLVMENYLLANGIIGYDKSLTPPKLINLVKKEDLRRIERNSEEWNKIMSQVRVLHSDEELVASGNHGKPGRKFVCGVCGGEESVFEAGCNNPKCLSCGEHQGGDCG